jgi:Zn-dependent alcohol dehydrogenase
MSRGEVPFAELVDPILPLDRVAEGFNALHTGYKLAGKDVLKIALRGGLA